MCRDRRPTAGSIASDRNQAITTTTTSDPASVRMKRIRYTTTTTATTANPTRHTLAGESSTWTRRGSPGRSSARDSPWRRGPRGSAGLVMAFS
ncbi:hypothetical protein [Nonomuraea salmonea]|uniref:hypothetical protein n=1 Tax=Nonomuraea salmonea TaxID=46181 RepID=UPI0031F0C568